MLTLQNRTYLPEQFLWRLFHSLATVAQIMADGDYNNLDTGDWDPREPYDPIHVDIKPLNRKYFLSSQLLLHVHATTAKYFLCQLHAINRH